MDDTLIIWPQDPDNLRDFLEHLNSVLQNIQFTMKMVTQIFMGDLVALWAHRILCSSLHTDWL
jgi:hypothetical protein